MMGRALYVCLLLCCLCACTVAETVFFPAKCASICVNGFQDVSSSTDDFFTIDPDAQVPEGKKPPFQTSRASAWGVGVLMAVKQALRPLATPFVPIRSGVNNAAADTASSEASPALAAAAAATQDVTFSPPAVARLLGVYSMAVYQAFAVYYEWQPFKPLSSDMLNLADPSQAAEFDVLSQPVTQYTGDQARGAQRAAISGAASEMLQLFFCGDNTPIWCSRVRPVIDRVMESAGSQDRADYPDAFQQGADIAGQFFKQIRLSDLLVFEGDLLPADVKSIPPSQPTAAVHSCSSLATGWWAWQRLTAPKSGMAFTPAKSAVFPPASYSSLTPDNKADAAVQSLRGYAAQLAAPALKATSEATALLLRGIKGPPRRANAAAYDAEMQRVLKESAQLDDVNKTIAEFWADGPDSTTPPGHWFRIALEESNSNLEGISDNALDKAVWATFAVGVALHESAVLAWRLKMQYMGARPITGIQCRLGRDKSGKARQGTAWRGPYLGVGKRNLGTWQPYQAINFITPPFPGYLSGHATFSASAAEALKMMRSGFNSSFSMPGYNCFKTSAGFSFVEPKLVAGSRGYVAGVTDVPNTGPRTIGYSPANDIVFCWENYEQAAQQAAMSRLYGGIHIKLDNDDGLVMGKRIGAHVAGALARLAEESNNLPKAEISTRVPVGVLEIPEVIKDEKICPPGTFFSGVYDGRADASGIKAIVFRCSDGTWMYMTPNGLDNSSDEGKFKYVVKRGGGIQGVAAGITPTGAVGSLSIVQVDGTTSPTFGGPTTTNSDDTTGTTTTPALCPDGERLVGLGISYGWGSNGFLGLGAFELLCGTVPEVDSLYFIDMVPPDNPEDIWSYYYEFICPDGTFATRFFGRASSSKGVQRLTVTCSNGWMMAAVGWSNEGDAFTDNSADGYAGVTVVQGQFGVDGLSFSPFDDSGSANATSSSSSSSSSSGGGSSGSSSSGSSSSGSSSRSHDTTRVASQQVVAKVAVTRRPALSARDVYGKGGGSQNYLACDEGDKVIGVFGKEGGNQVNALGIICAPAGTLTPTAAVAGMRKNRA